MERRIIEDLDVDVNIARCAALPRAPIAINMDDAGDMTKDIIKKN